MIVLDDVHKRLDNRAVLRGVNLHVKKGETVVIVGSSGTGKSVTLKHMVGLLRPDQGKVLIDNEEITTARGSGLYAILNKFGVLFQSGALINWMTVFENIALPLYEKSSLGDEEIRNKVREKLELVNLSDCENKRPGEISGGMKKRVALARAIIAEPEILLYDEPTSGLDPIMARHIDRLIVSMQEKLNVTSVVVTHDLHSAFTVGDRVAMLFEGQVAELNTPQEFVKSKHEFVQEFIKSQFASGKMEGYKL